MKGIWLPDTGKRRTYKSTQNERFPAVSNGSSNTEGHRSGASKITLPVSGKLYILFLFCLYLYWTERTFYNDSNVDAKLPSDGGPSWCARASTLPASSARYFLIRRLERKVYRSVNKLMRIPSYTKYLMRRHLLKSLRHSLRRHRRKKRQELGQFEFSEVSRTPVVILSAAGRRRRVLYATSQKMVVAGKPYSDVVRERRRFAPIYFDLIKWKNDTYSLLLKQDPNEINLYVIADTMHNGLRTCRKSNAHACIRTDSTNATIASPVFKLIHTPSPFVSVLTYRFKMAFELAGTIKYVQLNDENGESTLENDGVRATKFMMVLAIDMP